MKNSDGHNIMIVGAGGVGIEMAKAILMRGYVRELTLADLPQSKAGAWISQAPVTACR
jgi:malate/lactate dehydrogenase